jgi:hypothetical protein
VQRPHVPAKGKSKDRRAIAKRRHRAPKKRAAAKTRRKWSARVMKTSDAMDLEHGVFTKPSARQIAPSLRNSATASKRRKSSAFRSSMSMLNFEINRAGKNLSADRRRILNRAKTELRKVFHRPPARGA